MQGECLKDFYKLFALEKINDKVLTNTELPYLYGTTYFDINRISGLLSSEIISKLLGGIINNNVIPTPIRPKEMERAQRNSYIIEEIQNHALQKVKSKRDCK
jgi:hypothetical protein